MWPIHMLEYSSAIRRKWFPERSSAHATTWVSLEDSMFSEIIQTQKVTYCMILFL